MNTHFTERWQRKEIADECRAQAIECNQIAERHYEVVKEQYGALTCQWLIVAAQRIRTC